MTKDPDRHHHRDHHASNPEAGPAHPSHGDVARRDAAPGGQVPHGAHPPHHEHPEHDGHSHVREHAPAEEPPAEPGYPEHPELQHPSGDLPGSSASPTHPAHHGHEAHGGHTAATGHGAHVEHGADAGHGAQGAPGGHDKHAGHSPDMFRSKFWLSLALTLPTVIWGHMLPELTGFHPPHFPGSEWIAPVFGTIVFVYGGWVFLQGASRELQDRLPGMMTLISLAITVAFVFSVAVLLGFPGMPLWDELATLVTIMLLGHWMEMRSIIQAQGALSELAKLLPSTATRIVDGSTEEVPIAELHDGDLVLIRPGESIPADGVVREGRSAVNESMITGESRPVEKLEGEEVIAATVNGSGSLRVEVTKTGERTTLAGIMRLVEQAQTSRSRAQALADRAAFFLTFVAVGAGALTLVVWQALGAEWGFTIERVVTTLVIACPHALGLAIPLVIAISTTLGARNGLLVRDRRGLEDARNLDAVVFDKTGTLTLGEFRVVEMTTADGLSDAEALGIAAAVERDSEHPIAQGIVRTAEERAVSIPEVRGFEAIPGHGVRADLDGRELLMGGPALLRMQGVEPAPGLLEAAERAAGRGQAAIYLLEGSRAHAVFAVADAVRDESREAIRRLHDKGIEVVMLTGDARPVAEAVARELRIDTVFAEVLPGQKAEKIKELQAQGKRVAMVGDGVNDAPALLTADVGIAIGAGTGVAVEAGDVVLVRSDPRDVPRIVALSKATYRKMIQNLWWAAGYNIFAIPLAAGVLAPWGIILHPALGAILMSASTVIVAMNAQWLRRAAL
ncbi:MAG: heavy metal translocating P-type ATPase [Gemmatimonadetes bacterium]|nr:heavy metal translocating P-type ATPase [Gemmatimonadota bacterium]